MAITLYFYPYYARIVWICFRLFAILDVKIFELCDKGVKFFFEDFLDRIGFQWDGDGFFTG